MKILALITTLLISCTAVAKQKYYKWTDENGSIQYSLEKPENNKTDEISINTNQPVMPQKINEAVPKNPNEKSYMEKHEEKKQNSKNIAKENKNRCLDAKHTITKYQQQVRMSRIDKETGEKVYLDDSKRAGIIEQAEQAVRKYCN